MCPRTAIRNVVHNDDTMRAAVVCGRYCTESFLTYNILAQATES